MKHTHTHTLLNAVLFKSETSHCTQTHSSCLKQRNKSPELSKDQRLVPDMNMMTIECLIRLEIESTCRQTIIDRTNEFLIYVKQLRVHSALVSCELLVLSFICSFCRHNRSRSLRLFTDAVRRFTPESRPTE